MATREDAYDEHIAPLMTKIIEACQKHDIPMVASFQLDQDREVPDFFCTTAILPEDSAPNLKEAYKHLKPVPASFVAMSVDGAGNVTIHNVG